MLSRENYTCDTHVRQWRRCGLPFYPSRQIRRGRGSSFQSGGWDEGEAWGNVIVYISLFTPESWIYSGFRGEEYALNQNRSLQFKKGGYTNLFYLENQNGNSVFTYNCFF